MSDDGAFDGTEELEFFHLDGGDETKIVADSEPDRGDLLIFEAELFARQKGVRGCMRRRDAMIDELVNRHADLKSKETGLKVVWKGHGTGNAHVGSGRDGIFGSGGRWCIITINLKCIAHFERG